MTDRTRLDRIIGYFSPSWELQRMKARSVANAVRAYEATKPNRYRRAAPSSEGPNDAQLSMPALRNLARDLEQNNDIARSVVKTLTARIVGQGIVPDPQVMDRQGKPARKVREAIRTLWREWVERPEVTRQHHYYRLQRLMFQRWLVDGEVLKKRLLGSTPGLQHATEVPFSIEAIESDYLPYDFDDFNGRIRAGVEMDEWGRPIRYHLYRDHPNERRAILSTTRDMLESFPAEIIDHARIVDRLGQVRGVTQFAAVISRLDDIKDIDEAERVAARAAAMFAVAIKRGDPGSWDPANYDADGRRNVELRPGMVMDTLLPGEDIEIISGNRPNPNLINHQMNQTRYVAAGTQSSHSSVTRNYSQGSYSAQRQELVESYQDYGIIWHDFVTDTVVPDYRAFIQMASASGLLPRTGYDPATLMQANYSRPVMPWVDPNKEATAWKTLLDAQVESPQQFLRGRGRNPDDVISEMREWDEKTEDLRPRQGQLPLESEDEDE